MVGFFLLQVSVQWLRGLRGEIIGLRILKLGNEARKRSEERLIPRARRDAVFLYEGGGKKG